MVPQIENKRRENGINNLRWEFSENVVGKGDLKFRTRASQFANISKI